MEQSAAFKDVQDTIKVLEKRLAMCANVTQLCEQTAIDSAKQIEEHFALCLNTIAERKTELLREVTQKLDSHSMCNIFWTRILCKCENKVASVSFTNCPPRRGKCGRCAR